MSELSFPWDGTTLGDATTAPYSATEWNAFFRDLLAPHNTSPFQRSALLPFVGWNNLLVTGTATPVSVSSGTAVVSGIWYQSTAPTTIAVPTPAVNPRIDRVVLRATWATQTVRLALLAGAEAATPSPPALTQTLGTTWEVSLAQVYITTGGVITVRDERVGFMGLGSGIIFRDIAERTREEFYDHFYNGIDVGAGGVPWGWQWQTTGGAGPTQTVNTGVPTSWAISTGATAARTGILLRGDSTQYPIELNEAPLLFEARMQIATAVDANGTIVMRLIDSAGTSYIEYGMRGSVSTTNLMVRDAAGGAATSFTTGQAVDTAAYHTYGIYVPQSGGPVVVFYDRVAIGQIAGNIPAATTDMRAEFFVGNGATAAARSLNIDMARLVRGTG